MKPTPSGGPEMDTEPATPRPAAPPPAPAHVLARKVWAAFAFTFVLSRILVFLIMSGRMPDIHSHFRGTHLHHLNYGIVLLAGVGAVLLFSRPTGRWLSVTAILYGVGLALTFDEFGMWLHLNGGTGRRPRRSWLSSQCSGCCWPTPSATRATGSNRISSACGDSRCPSRVLKNHGDSGRMFPR